MRRRLGREAIEPLAHAAALRLGPALDGRAAADGIVQLPHARAAALRDESAQLVLERQAEELAIGEELQQERLDVVERLRSTEIEHHDAGPPGCRTLVERGIQCGGAGKVSGACSHPAEASE